MRPGPFQPPRLADIGGLVEARLEFHQRGDRLAILCRFAERIDNGRVLRGAVERLLDRHHVGVARRLSEKADHHVEGLVGVVQEHVLLADRGEHVAIVILHPLGHSRREGRPEQVAPFLDHQLLEIRKPDHPFHLDHLLGVDMQLAHDRLAQRLRRPGRDLEPHHLAPPAPLERHLEFAHQILGLFLDFQIAVAQHPEAAMRNPPVAWEQAVEIHQQELFQRQGAIAARR